MSYCEIEHRDGIAIVWLDEDGSAVNTLGLKMLDEFEALADDLENNSDIKGAVLISRKPDTFIAGADLKALVAGTAEEATALSQRGNALLSRMAKMKKPVVAAIHGACLGGGNEVAMACHYRIATDSSKTVFGQSEVKLGLLPGGGGTQRLPRLIGLTKSLDALLTGKNIYPYPAMKMGLIDALIHPEGLLEAAIAVARKGIPKRKDKRSRFDKIAAGFGPLRNFVLNKAEQTVMAKTRGNYPAPKKILECVRAGLEDGIKTGLDVESKGFGELQDTSECKQLIGLFLGMQAAKKNPFQKSAKEVDKIAMLGAGFMGSGITEVTINKGIDVILRDLKQEGIAKALAGIYKNLTGKVKKRALTAFQRDQIMSHIHGTTDVNRIKGSDMVIEAVFEELDIKQKVLAEVESICDRSTIFASNTSSLPLKDIAANAKYPKNIIGMHYFSPVPKMPLLELVVTDKTSNVAKGTAISLGQQQGKTVVVVNDGPGFYTTRVLTALTNEALALLAEGAKVEAVDSAMKDFGFPVGPITLMDEVGIDVGAHIARGALGEMFKERGIEGRSEIFKLDEAGLHGRKNGKGFYLYPKKGKKKLNESVYKFFGGKERKDFAKSDIQDRIALIFCNECVHCLQEGILNTPADGDLAAILGLGFPPFRGGPFRHLDAVGSKAVVEKLEALAEQHGDRFKPAKLLADKAKKDQSFHG